MYFQPPISSFPPLVHLVLILQRGFAPLLADDDVSVKMHLFLFLLNLFQVFSYNEKNISFPFYRVFFFPQEKTLPKRPIDSPVCVGGDIMPLQAGSKQHKQ